MPLPIEQLEADLITPLLKDDPKRHKQVRKDGLGASWPRPSPARYFDELVEKHITDEVICQQRQDIISQDKYLFMRAAIVISAANAYFYDQVWKMKREIIKSELSKKLKAAISAVNKVENELEALHMPHVINLKNMNTFESSVLNYGCCAEKFLQSDILETLEALDKSFKDCSTRFLKIKTPDRIDAKFWQRAFLAMFARAYYTVTGLTPKAAEGPFPALALEALKEAGDDISNEPEHQIRTMLSEIKTNPSLVTPPFSTLYFSHQRADGLDGITLLPSEKSPAVRNEGPTLALFLPSVEI